MKLTVSYEETASILNSFLFSEEDRNEKSNIKILPDKKGVAVKVLTSRFMNIPLGQTFRLELIDYSEGSCWIRVHADNLFIKLLIRIVINVIYKRLKNAENQDEKPLTDYFLVKSARIRIYLAKILEDFEIPFKISSITAYEELMEISGTVIHPG